MAQYSTGTIVASAIIVTPQAEAEPIETPVAVGDKVTITYALANGETESREGKVIGFQGRPRSIPRPGTRIYDGVPTYVRDPDGGAFYGTIAETLEIASIVVKPEEGSTMICMVDNITEISAEPGDDD